MENNKNYCKFVSQVKSSQVKSSQVKSSARIVSLIALLFILLFSISCKAKQNPNEGGSQSKSELVGKWRGSFIVGSGSASRAFTVDNNGNINLGEEYYPSGSVYNKYDYKGKLNDTFDYPYTVEISIEGYSNMINNTYIPGRHTGTITFNSSSSSTATWETMSTHNRWVKLTINNFEKQK